MLLPPVLPAHLLDDGKSYLLQEDVKLSKFTQETIKRNNDRVIYVSFLSLSFERGIRER